MMFNMNIVKLVNIPLDFHCYLSSSLCPSYKKEKDSMSRIPYASIVGSLMYAMECTSIYISKKEKDCMSLTPYASIEGSLMYAMECTSIYIYHAVSVVIERMENQGKEHCQAMKWVL